MRAVLFLSPLLFLGLAGIAVRTGTTGIQLGLAAVSFIGAVLMFGQIVILSGQRAILKRLPEV